MLYDPPTDGCIVLPMVIDTPKKGKCDKEKYDAEQALHGASLPREFERQDMAKIFNKKIKTWYSILFKGVLGSHLMKAKGRA